MTESIAIMLYLTDAFPAAGIGPVVGDAERGPYLTWLAYYAGVIEPVLNFEFAGLTGNPALERTFRDSAAIHRRVLAGARGRPLSARRAFLRRRHPAGQPRAVRAHRPATRRAGSTATSSAAPAGPRWPSAMARDAG